MSPGALDLLEKMLVFDPNKRITGTRKELKFSCGITLNNWLLFQVFCFVLFFFFFHVFSKFSYYTFESVCSWRGTLSPILVISSWYERWACLPYAIRFWFWATIMYWRTHQRAHLEGISEVQSRPNPLGEMLCICSGDVMGRTVPLKVVYNSSHSLE